MRTFFFRTMKDKCTAVCRWRTCPERYLAALRNIEVLRNIEPLGEAPACYLKIREKAPKTGDLIILYAEDLHDLDALVLARERFDGMRKILILAEQAGGDDKKYHLLEPRYITQAWRNIAELEAVIHNMAGAVQ